MIEITCDRVQMIKILQVFEDSDECLIDCLSDHYCGCGCVFDFDFDCVRCLSQNIKWNIID